VDIVSDHLSDKAAAPHENGKHIVEALIEERAEKLMRSPLWPLYRSILYPLLKKQAAVRLADAVAPLSAHGVMGHVRAILNLDVRVDGLDFVPETGRVLIAPTHPTGIADGIAMYDALIEKRRDVVFFANRDAIRAAPQLEKILIPVEWVEAKRTRERSRETLASAKRAFEEDRCIVLFPSGRLAFMDENKVLTEQAWLTSIVTFARKYDCPVVPANLRGRNSWLYYWFWKINSELRDITLFNELLNKKGERFDLKFGPSIPVSDLQGAAETVTKALRAHAAYELLEGLTWEPSKPIALENGADTNPP